MKLQDPWVVTTSAGKLRLIFGARDNADMTLEEEKLSKVGLFSF